MDEELYIKCRCGSHEHQFSLYKENIDGHEMVFMTVHLAPTKGFFKRLWHGLRYAFGYRSKFGDFDEIIIDDESCVELEEFFKEYNQNNKEKDE